MLLSTALIPPDDSVALPKPIGLAPLARVGFAGGDLLALGRRLIDRAKDTLAGDPDTLMDLSIIMQLAGNREGGLAVQADALKLQPIHRRLPANPSANGLRLLVFMAPGDFMANTPIEFLLEGSDVALDLLYLGPNIPAPEQIPEHDLAFVGISESDENRPILEQLDTFIDSWPRPVLNRPDSIIRLTRDGTSALLRAAPGITIPRNTRIARDDLARLGRGEIDLRAILDDGTFPIIARPAASHAGQGLAKIENPSAIIEFLEDQPEADFYVARFVDYSGPDRQFRKYRIAFIDGRAYACHMAISSYWMVHYLNAGMTENEEKRAEEARWMENFEREFAPRHERAFRVLAERIGLDYFGIDCAETRDGALLIFEVDIGMIVHDMDAPDMFPYKKKQMPKVFAAFRDLLAGASRRAPGTTRVGTRRALSA